MVNYILGSNLKYSNISTTLTLVSSVSFHSPSSHPYASPSCSLPFQHTFVGRIDAARCATDYKYRRTLRFQTEFRRRADLNLVPKARHRNRETKRERRQRVVESAWQHLDLFITSVMHGIAFTTVHRKVH